MINQSQEIHKMNEFFKFLFNDEILNSVLRPQWIKIYDFMYVDDTLISALKKSNEIYMELINHINSKAYASSSITYSTVDMSGTSGNTHSKKITVPEPFNLTKPKQKVFLEPIAIPFKVEVTNIPDFTKFNLDKLEEENKKRKDEIGQVYKNCFNL